MTDTLTQQIAQALAQAAALDGAAREQRRRAGHLMAEAREGGSAWYASTGLDRRYAELLIELAAGARPSDHER